jgi:hypothetical protein
LRWETTSFEVALCIQTRSKEPTKETRDGLIIRSDGARQARDRAGENRRAVHQGSSRDPMGLRRSWHEPRARAAASHGADQQAQQRRTRRDYRLGRRLLRRGGVCGQPRTPVRRQLVPQPDGAHRCVHPGHGGAQGAQPVLPTELRPRAADELNK